MRTRTAAAPAICAAVLSGLLGIGCTGGSESNASVEKTPSRHAEPTEPKIDARAALASISDAIPVYADAEYRDDLTRRDAVMIRNQYGPNAEVFTLATNDSFPQVYHYYMTYLAQFRAFPAQETYPNESQNWRTLEVPLNQAMQDPFIPGDTLPQNGKQVILQVAETEAEPKTVIRYIILPTPPAVPAVAAATAQPAATVAP
jgi:hypothetical protein